MELSPRLYHYLVRPRFLTKCYIEKIIRKNFNLNDKKVLDFGSGVGSSSIMFKPGNYMGIDPDKSRVEYARSLFPGHKFEVLQDKRLPLSDYSIDYILIIAVLHHVSSEDIKIYLQDFRRVLKPHGKVLVIEPCFFEKSFFNNKFMAFFDKGKYIRYEDEYLELFNGLYQTKIIKRFNKIFYNEIFFTAF